MKSILVLTSLLLSALAYFSDFTGYESISIGLFLFFTLNLVDNFNKTIWSILDILVVLALLTWLIMPLLSYYHFDKNNYLATLWDRVMKIDSDTYYSFMLPATLTMILGLKWPFLPQKEIKIPLTELVKLGKINRPSSIGYSLIVLGVLMTIFRSFLPGSVGFVVYLLIKSSIVGFFYLYYCGQQVKNSYLLLGFGVLIFTSIQNGMFGEMIYMVLISIIIISIGKKMAFTKKLSGLAIVFLLTIILQSIKGEYRSATWRGDNSGGDTGLFVNLVANRLNNTKELLSDEMLFGFYYRFNQGFLIGSVMKRVPSVVPFSGGESIQNSLLSTIIPRVLWPNKPSVGGAYNIEHFLGQKQSGTSQNISPVGEAWANYGYTGGILFMFGYGFVLRLIFNELVKFTYRYPTLLFWFPLIFYYVVVAETDVLSVYNHLLKSLFFVWAMYKIAKGVFKVKL